MSAATPLLSVMLRRPRAPAVAAAVARVMRRLTVADLVGKCAVACASLMADAPLGGGDVAAVAAGVTAAMTPLRQLAVALPDLAEAVAAGSAAISGGRSPLLGAEMNVLLTHGSLGPTDGPSVVPEPPALDPPVLQMLAARRLFLMLAAALDSVHAHAGALRQAGEAAVAAAAASGGATEGLVSAQQTLAYANAHLTQAHTMLLQGLRMLLVPLLSCPSGLSLVTAPACRPGVAALVAALDPTIDDAVATAAGISVSSAPRRATSTAAAAAATAAGGGAGGGPGAELAAMLCDALASEAAVRSLSGLGGGASSAQGKATHGSGPGSEGSLDGPVGPIVDPAELHGPLGPPIQTLLHMCGGSEPGRQAAALALSASRPALAALMRAVRARGRAVKALAAAAAGQDGGGGRGGHGAGFLYDEDDHHDMVRSGVALW